VKVENDDLELVTGLIERERKKVLTWITSLPETNVIDIIQDSVKKAYQIKNERPEMPGKLVKYCAIIVAARNAGWDTVQGKGYRVAEEKQFDDFVHLRKTAMAKIIRTGRPSILRKKVMAHWGEVKGFKKEGIGFRPIAEYLMKKRRVKVSVTYLSMLWKEVEENHA